MDADLTLRDARAKDAGWMNALNNDCAPAMNAMNPAEFAAVLAGAARTRIVERAGQVLGALITYDHLADAYESANYDWFRERFSPFSYVDRVMVLEGGRETGAGRALYEDLTAWTAEHGLERICCEVNERPANPGSIAFHQKLGFEQVDSFENPNGKRVAMLTRLV